MNCGICHKELVPPLLLDVDGEEWFAEDPEWGRIHKKCQDSIPSKND